MERSNTYSTNRGLCWETDHRMKMELRMREPVNFGVLDILGLGVVNIINKKVLDIGVGGGRALEQARMLRIDYYGIEVIPGIDFKPQPLDKWDDGDRLGQLRFLATIHPGRIVCADAGEALPFRDDSFDTVLSCIAIPEYLRYPEQVTTSILEMIRVSAGRVVFSQGETEKYRSSRGLRDTEVFNHSFGLPSTGTFYYSIANLLGYLGRYGITYSIRGSLVQKPDHTPLFTNYNIVTENKRSEDFERDIAKIITQTSKFLISRANVVL